MAEKVTMTPYPVPDGMRVPNLMPYQLVAFNGDGYLAAEVLRLKEVHGLTCAIETGTCLGSTTIWLSKNFAFCTSTEVHEPYKAIAMARMSTHANDENWMLLSGSPEKLIEEIINAVGFDTLCYLDGHWGPNCPLINELNAIAKTRTRPCIVIHDFQVPGTDFGFDKMPDGRPFNLDLIRTLLDAIYGVDGWKHNYPTQVEGAKRGWISIEPA